MSKAGPKDRLCYTYLMLSIAEQRVIRARLDSLSNDQLVELWHLCHIEFTSDHPEEIFKANDREWLIGPLFADTSYEELSSAIDQLRDLPAL
jgi:hypothetical protein